jgi:hypothetical protein
MLPVNIPLPGQQLDFARALKAMRASYLQDALFTTVKKVDLVVLDHELAAFVPLRHLQLLASRGLRGELVFPMPSLISANPYLIGYYRLILGFSQKEFYATQYGASTFKSAEDRGVLSDRGKALLKDFCDAMVKSASALIEGLEREDLSAPFLDDLTLLTLGPQLRGGANVKKGIEGTSMVFKVIYEIVNHAVTASFPSKLNLLNAAGRSVLIAFAPDPDIVIQEAMYGDGEARNIIAIEVKGGTDFSNIHNRIGEAEKSHQKAKANGYVECWTVVNVDQIDLHLARQESPSTNRFYRLSDLSKREGNEYEDFKRRIISLTGITSGEV